MDSQSNLAGSTVEHRKPQETGRRGRRHREPDTDRLLEALEALYRGNFSYRMEADGLVAEAVNRLAARGEQCVSELARATRIVGREGRFDERASVEGLEGHWRLGLGSVNAMMDNLATPLNQFAEVVRAIAVGDFSVRMTAEVGGDFQQLKHSLNALVQQLSDFSSEVTRVAMEVGADGKLGGQADVRGTSGTWKHLIDSVNMLAGNLTSQVRSIALVTTAIARGDLTQKITVEARGELLALKDTINTMVDQLSSFASEVTRVAKEVGTEGKLGSQARVKGIAGTWKDLTDNVNAMASNLTDQVRSIATVTTAVARGDLSQKIKIDALGEILELKNTINTMVDQLSSFAAEVTRVAREVGTEGRLGGQAEVPGVGGTWKDLTNNVNAMASNLTNQVRNIAKVTTAVAQGDLSQKITVDVRGEMLELKNTINTMVDQLSSFASEVTRVAKEVGTEGELGGQAHVKGVSGTWKDLTDNVNAMASNLTVQLRDVSRVATAIANGDLGQKVTVEAHGEILQIKDVVNKMVDTLNSFADEVSRVALEVGTQGKLGGQAVVGGVSGTWKQLTDNVNSLAANLTSQVRNIAKVTTAVAKGDLTQTITVEASGEILELKSTINTMVDQLSSFASEVTRVAKEVGTDGKLGGQAEVQGVGGTWKDLTDNVNAMASNLTVQLRDVSRVATAIATGDLSQKVIVEARGEILRIKAVVNGMVETLNSFASEVTRVAKEVGTEGKLGGQADVKGVAGTWKDLTDNVNFMAANVTKQVRGIAKVVTAVANGDLTKKFVLEAKGEVAEFTETINQMVETLRVFADQVTTVAREVGVEGKLGVQATVPGVAGTWKDLTENVNFMASNLTQQVRGIANVVTAVANGDLTQKFVLQAKGEVAQFTETINQMVETLRIFADQVTTVAREVGIEGKLGGQANVPGAAGTWRGLTDNVNQLAGNLTTQVRAIAEVATAVTKGDLSRAVTVEAKGEVLELKNNVNKMIENLRSTTQSNREQDWLKSNLAKLTGLMQSQRTVDSLTSMIMSELTPLIAAQYGAFYVVEGAERERMLRLAASYAFFRRKGLSDRIAFGEGLVGQCAAEKKPIIISDVPDDYVQISSALGHSRPRYIGLFPVIFEGDLKAVIELGSFQGFSDVHFTFLQQLMQSIGVVINMITANMRTEELLEELQRSNATLKARREELEAQAAQLESKNREIAAASASIEEKARELSQISKYKSDFLANMSHELRTPLNSMLILARMLSENPDKHLSPKEVEYAKTVYSAGQDLLALINEILDLSKVEAGKIEVAREPVRLQEIADFAERHFRAVMREKGLEFSIRISPEAPPVIVTDERRLKQIIKNLLSNAVKFTERGHVALDIGMASPSSRFRMPALLRARSIVSFAVSDTGIGIPEEKQRVIFEAFQQADTTTSRRYGGTGLGLTISRQLARLLSGELTLRSAPDKGSTFTLYLPVDRAVLEEPWGAASAAMETAPDHAVDHGAAGEEVEESPPPQGAKPLQGRTLMLVDDDPRNLYSMTGQLERLGAEVHAFDNATDALERLETGERYDALLLDIMMPGIDGYQAAGRIRANADLSGLPIIAVSAKAMPEDRQRAMDAGFSDYLAKPLNVEQLSATLLEWVKDADADRSK